jgi:hypothetical protein
MKYYIENGKTGKMELLLVEEIKNKLQAGDMILDTPCLSQKGAWEMVKNIFTASERQLLVLPETKPESCETDQIWEADQQWPELQKMKANFENKEAILVEKGVTKVQVLNIYCPGARQYVKANFEEVYISGLSVGIFYNGGEVPASPRRWDISGEVGDGMEFSDDEWFSTSQGGTWNLYFHPQVIKDVLELAGQLSGKVDGYQFYRQVLRFLHLRKYPQLRHSAEGNPNTRL